MHTFQPMPTDVLEFNPFTKFGKDWALVTAGTKEKANPMTISWGGVGVIWGKNAAYIFIRDSRYTKELLDKNDFFSISFLPSQYREALAYCGSFSGRGNDKFEKAGITPTFRHGIPYVDEGNFILLCQKMAAARLTEEMFLTPDIGKKWYANGDMHTMYIAEIIDILAR